MVGGKELDQQMNHLTISEVVGMVMREPSAVPVGAGRGNAWH